MTTKIVFKDTISESITIELGKQYTSKFLVDREGRTVIVADRMLDKNFEGEHVQIRLKSAPARQGSLWRFADDTYSGEQLGLLYVESITHTSRSKER